MFAKVSTWSKDPNASGAARGEVRGRNSGEQEPSISLVRESGGCGDEDGTLWHYGRRHHEYRSA